MKKKHRWVSLRTKMNVLLVTVILFVSFGLLGICYAVHSRAVDRYFIAEVDKAARAAVNDFASDSVLYIRKVVVSDEFQAVRAQAEKVDDESILKEWMASQASYMKDIPAIDYSLYDSYQVLLSRLTALRDVFGVTSVYLRYDLNGVTYRIADPEGGLLRAGTVVQDGETLRPEEDNAEIWAVVHRGDRGWLCTACQPIPAPWRDGEVIGCVGVDMDMNQAMRERHRFLLNSILFVAVLTAGSLCAGMLLVKRTAVEPLKRLAGATRKFTGITGDYTPEDIMREECRPGDEIGDLYQDIREMQEHIVENTRNLARIAAEEERVNTEMRLAADIQRSMLPDVFPPYPERKEFDLYASMEPAREVGGDFYDFFLVDEDHLALVIADVSGKGVPAALFMMSAKILISNQAMTGAPPAEILDAVNKKLCASNQKVKMFVTVWLGILEIPTGVMTCASAGHEYPFVRTAEGGFRLYKDPHGLVAGGLKTTRYKDYQLVLRPGDQVFVYTDGVPDAVNEQGTRFGMERLEETLKRLEGESCRGVLEGVKQAVERFAGDAEPYDDLTMLCLSIAEGKKKEKDN
ncbi:MAG: PP2C family protein-serine/threonine phosphatase [Clostridia bacterium]|nr:PP2C family protein-serine/threonine phosphatase [Clostridia bacterium]